MQEAATVGKQLGLDEPTLFGMTHWANSLVFLTRFDEAMAQTKAALASAEEKGNLRYQAELLTFALPTCLLREGRFEEVAAALERGVETARRIGSYEAETYGCIMQGKLAIMRRAYQDALTLPRRVLEASEATGISCLRALGLCAMGTCCQAIGGKLQDEGAEYHRRTLEVSKEPAGTTFGAWIWSEVGQCALAAGDLETARTLFERARTVLTAPMYLMRPETLIGECSLALMEGRVQDAKRIYGELEMYVRERQMRQHEPLLPLLEARVEAAAGEHQQALDLLAPWGPRLAQSQMHHLELQLQAAQASSEEALGRSEQAAQRRESAHAVADLIAAGIADPELREVFLAGVRPCFAAV